MSNNNELAIVVDHVSKDFILPHEKATSVKSGLINAFRHGKKTKEVQHVLKDISFEIKKGEFFGIVGRNGSGKSTLLKILAQIYQPTKGNVKVNGKLVPFIELGVGFNPELTGRENVFLNGALLGFTRREMEDMYAEIVEFAELEYFMDQKLKNYSSGMQVRLAFSIAIRANTDILVLDEVLAVGDEAFQRKCYDYFGKLKKNKKTVIFVTHGMDNVQLFCDKAIMIEKGNIVISGNPAEVAQRYRELFMNKESIGKKVNNATIANKDISIKSYLTKNDDYLNFDITIQSKSYINNPVVTFVINNERGELVYRWVSDEKLPDNISLNKDVPYSFKLQVQNIFPNGNFTVNIAVKKRDRSLSYAAFRDIISFEITNPGKNPGDTYWKPIENYEQRL